MERIFQIYPINLDEINLEMNKYNRLKTELFFFYNHSRCECKQKNSYLYLIDDTYLEKVYKHTLLKFIPYTIHNSIRRNHNTFSFYKYETIFYMYIQKDKYLKYNLFKRLGLWLQISEQLVDYDIALT